MAVEVLLSLGSNIDREYHLCAALDALAEAYGNIEMSPVYESDAVGFDGNAFYNLVVAISTEEPLAVVNQRLKQIEDNCGRDRSQPKYSSRTLDIDVLTYGDAHGAVSGIALPRDEVYRHAFVLKPLADLRPGMPVPGDTLTWADLWLDFSASDQPLRQINVQWHQQKI